MPLGGLTRTPDVPGPSRRRGGNPERGSRFPAGVLRDDGSSDNRAATEGRWGRSVHEPLRADGPDGAAPSAGVPIVRCTARGLPSPHRCVPGAVRTGPAQCSSVRAASACRQSGGRALRATAARSALLPSGPRFDVGVAVARQGIRGAPRRCARRAAERCPTTSRPPGASVAPAPRPDLARDLRQAGAHPARSGERNIMITG